MDQITLLILTVVINALVTGTIVFIFQKRIEASIAKKDFEHQIKFSKLYPKSLDVIETYRQKLLNRRGTAFRYYTELSYMFFRNEVDEKRFEESRRSALDASNEMQKHINDNIIYIPKRFLAEVNEIRMKARALSVPDLIHELDGDMDWKRKRFIDQLIEATDSIDQISYDDEPNGATALVLLVRMNDKYNELIDRLEKIYKSVADFPD